jgi:hypothetical protein
VGHKHNPQRDRSPQAHENDRHPQANIGSTLKSIQNAFTLKLFSFLEDNLAKAKHNHTSKLGIDPILQVDFFVAALNLSNTVCKFVSPHHDLLVPLYICPNG